MAMVIGILSIVPSVDGTDFLKETAPHKNQVLTGAFFQFLLIPIYLGFAILLYPILKQQNSGLAVGFVGFRIIAAAFQIIGIVLLPLLIHLSQEYITANAKASLYSIELIGQVLKLGRDLSNHVGQMLATGLGNLMLYYVLVKYNLLPKWLGAWGLIANALGISTSFLILFSLIDVVSAIFISLSLPLVLHEIVLAIWFIRRRRVALP